MAAPRKVLAGGLVLALCGSSLGCAGNPLRNMFAWNRTSDYKSLEELEAEERGESTSAGLVADSKEAKPTFGERMASWSPFSRAVPEDVDSTVAADETATAKSTADSESDRRVAAAAAAEDSPATKSTLFPFGGKSKHVAADPFLNVDELNAGRTKAAEKVEPLIAGTDAATTSTAAAVTKKEDRFASLAETDQALDSKIRRTSAETEQLFADLASGSKSTAAAGQKTDNSDSEDVAEPLIKADSRERRTAASEKPVDDLEALLARENPFAEATAPKHPLSSPSPKTAAAFPTPEATKQPDGPVSAFDRLITAAGTKTPPQVLPAATAAAADRAARIGQSAANASADAFDALFSSASDAVAKTEETVRKTAETDPLAAAGMAVAQSLTADSGFAWKDSAARTALPEIQSSAAGWWNATTSAAADQVAGTFPNGRNAGSVQAPLPPGQAGNDSSQSDRPVFEENRGSYAATLTIPPVHTASSARVMDSASGFGQDDPFFADELPSPTAVASVQSTSGVHVLGKLPGVSLRTVGLLLGCIIVAFLLFAPNRRRSAPARR